MATSSPPRTSQLPVWAGPVVVGAVALAGCVTIALLDPQTRGQLTPACPFKAATGWDCPGCGSTRALHALTQGDPLLAADHNLLVVLLLPVLAWAWVAWLRFRLVHRSVAPTLAPGTTFGLVAVLVAFWVLRNLPFAPWAWLGSGVAT